MPNTREKLVELLAKHCAVIGDYNCKASTGSCTIMGCAECLADHLIANGVTVQEWISVKDRLPEPFVSVLVQMPGEAPHPTVREGSISRSGIWHSALYDREPDEVTHWQPMPQPPKGE